MQATRTVIPQRRKKILRRPRLAEKMRGQLERALTLISAPAGYGKTSLLVDLCRDAPFAVCWLSLDESDRDLRAFVLHLLEAIQRRFPGFGGPSLRALDASPDFKRGVSALCNVLLQDLADHVPEFFVLVLDDYHMVDEMAAVGDLLGAIAKHADGRWHVVVSGRTVPGNLPAIDLVAQEQMAFVSQRDLAFTTGEVQLYLKLRHDLELTPGQAEELVASSEGWITGIVLATISVWGGIRDVLHQAQAQDGPIYAYLADCAFEAQPKALRETMLTMSTLTEMNARLCRQALGLRGMESVLLQLERRGIFLTTVEDEGVTHYRYHHLFRDFLQERLRASDPGRFARLHAQAADYFAAQGQWVDAVAHRRAAGDQQAAARTMEQGAKPIFLDGRLQTLVSWYESLPPALRPRFPRLQLYVARALFNLGRADETIPILHRAEGAFRERGETKQMLAAMLQQATARYVQGRYADTLDVARESLAACAASGPDLPALTAEAHRLMGLACSNLGRSEQAVEHLQMALDLYQKLGRRETAVTYLDFASVLERLGRLGECWACQDKAIELYRATAPSGEFATALNNVAYGRHYLAGEYAPALALLREALDVARQAGSPRAQAFALLSEADVYRDLGALPEAQERYAQAEELARLLGHADLLNFALLGSAQTLAQTGELIPALGLAAQARDQAQQRGDVYQLGLACLALGAIHLQAGDAPTALTEVERGRDLLGQSGARRDLARACVLLARARQAGGAGDGALQALRQALDVGLETQTLHYLVVEGQHVFDLFKRLLEQNPADRRPAHVMDRIQDLPALARGLVGGPALAVLPQRPALRFYGLGPGYVERHGESVNWRSAKSRYLTFYLLTHPPCSREQLFKLFWSQARQDDVRGAFYWTTSQARKALGRNLLVRERGFYKLAWEPDCWFDVAVFESLLDGQGQERQAQLEDAISLYRGDFLEGYDAGWCMLLRERLRMRYRDALLELGQLYVQGQRSTDALAALNRAAALDDLHEPTICTLMRFYALDGQPRAALDLFHSLERQLDELRALPDQETRSLYRSVQAGSLRDQQLA